MPLKSKHKCEKSAREQISLIHAREKQIPFEKE